MKQIHLQISVCIVACLLGLLLFLYQDSWIIITSPFSNSNQQQETHQQTTTTKPVTLYALVNGKTKQETTTIVYSQNIAENIKHLLNAWILFIEDEHLINQENKIISVALSPSKQDAFICFNQYPFETSWSTYRKLMLIESLLKTLRENNIPIKAIRLLVQHQPLIDDHLNFNVSWPIIGFLKA